MNKKPAQQRTIPQNSALHKWCEQLADKLNDSGYTMQIISKFPIKAEFTPAAIKDLFRTIAQEQTGKDSTADLTTQEMQNAYEAFNLWLGEDLKIHIPWPSIENMLHDKE